MTYIINALIGFIALQHLGFLVLEMFLWTKPFGLKVFRQSMEKAQASAVLAANQGLYNGFLSVGLVWGLAHPNSEFSIQIKYFFLCCILIAGIYGGFTVKKSIFFIQAGPAILALLLMVLFFRLDF